MWAYIKSPDVHRLKFLDNRSFNFFKDSWKKFNDFLKNLQRNYNSGKNISRNKISYEILEKCWMDKILQDNM